MLVAVTSIGPMMEKSRKSALGTEGIALIKEVDGVFNAEMLKGADAKYTATSSVCYSLEYMCKNGYYDKGCGDDGYTGSVLITKNSSGQFEYYFWLSNGTYVYNGATKDNYGDIENTNILFDGTKASSDCGNKDIPAGTPTGTINIINELVSEGKSVSYVSIGDSEEVKVEDLSKNLIHFKFYFDDAWSFSYDFVAEEGMTWNEWLPSDYNQKNSPVASAEETCYGGYDIYIFYAYHFYMRDLNTKIIDGNEYELSAELPRMCL